MNLTALTLAEIIGNIDDLVVTVMGPHRVLCKYKAILTLGPKHDFRTLIRSGYNFESKEQAQKVMNKALEQFKKMAKEKSKNPDRPLDFIHEEIMKSLKGDTQ